MKPHTFAIAGVLATFALFLTACAAETGPPEQVPALATSGSASSPDSTETRADAGRPRERLDMTNEERVALAQPYNQCLTENGWDRGENGSDQAALAKAENACKSKNPLPPWELDASNPQAADFLHAVVQCLRDKGVQYVSEGSPKEGRYTLTFGGPDNDSESIDKGLQYTPECEKQVAAQGIGR